MFANGVRACLESRLFRVCEIARRIDSRGRDVRRDGNADVVEQPCFQRAVVIQRQGRSGEIQFRHGEWQTRKSLDSKQARTPFANILW